MTNCAARSRDRTVLFLSSPALWPCWPFLPVVRRSAGAEELGVVIDSRALGLTGFSATVWAANVFALPKTLPEFLALPHETCDSADEVVARGWRVD